MKFEALTLTLAAGMALALPAYASDRSDNTVFCAAIGLAQADQSNCVKQLNNTASIAERDYVQATWVARSPMIDVANAPVLGNSSVDGKPGSIYQHVDYVSNRVANEINRAIASVQSNPAMK